MTVQKGNDMKKKVILCDSRSDYPALLGRYIRNADCGLVLQAEADLSAAAALLAESRSAVLLIAEDLWADCPREIREKIRKTGRFCFLSEDSQLPEGGERIYRYRTAAEVTERLNGLFAETDSTGAGLIGVISPTGGAAAELCAQMAAEILAQNGGAFGLSLYPFPACGDPAAEETLSSVLYRFQAGAEELLLGAPPAGSLLCVSDPRDIWETDGEMLAGLAARLKHSAKAAYLTAAVPPAKGCRRILTECDHILLVNEAGTFSETAVRQFTGSLADAEEALSGKVTELQLPPLPAVRDRSEAFGMLRHGGFYAQVKAALTLAGLA